MGGEDGSVTAFERDRGGFARTYRPKSTGSTEIGENQFVVSGPRIYHADATWRLRGLAPRGPKA